MVSCEDLSVVAFEALEVIVKVALYILSNQKADNVSLLFLKDHCQCSDDGFDNNVGW